MSQITYADKVALSPQPDVADINKVTDDDMNMIKNSHNDTDNKVTNITGKILWTNPNPTNSIDELLIPFIDDDYDVLEIFYQQTTTDTRCYSQRILKGVNGRLFMPYNAAGTYIPIYRNFNRNSDTSYTVTTTSGISDNNAIIPIFVISYKTGLFNV